MSRQLRRQKARSELKKVRKGMGVARDVGWKEVPGMKNSKQPPKDSEAVPVFILGPVETRQDFELALREFGEAIQAADTVLPVPRIEYVAIFKPFPYETNEEMYAVCSTILEKYSPDNVYGLPTGTPPEDTDFTNEKHLYAFAYHLIVTQRKLQGAELEAELASKRLSIYMRDRGEQDENAEAYS